MAKAGQLWLKSSLRSIYRPPTDHRQTAVQGQIGSHDPVATHSLRGEASRTELNVWPVLCPPGTWRCWHLSQPCPPLGYNDRVRTQLQNLRWIHENSISMELFGFSQNAQKKKNQHFKQRQEASRKVMWQRDAVKEMDNRTGERTSLPYPHIIELHVP